MFPSDDILIARGKYSTLNHERRVQRERIQKAANHAMVQLQTLLKLVGTDDPNLGPIGELRRCIDSMDDAGHQVLGLCAALRELYTVAWDDSADDHS